MDSSDSGNSHRLVKSQFFASGAFHTEQEKLPCPRCESNDTKFCYYNNYNLSQPRYYCKSCRRYWTRGGALRDVPIGGAPRKGTKRPRTKTTTTMTITTPSSSSSSSFASPQEEETPSPILTISTQSFPVPPLIPVRSALNVLPMVMGGLSTYLNTPGVYAWNGFGYSGFNDLGNSIWPLTLPGMVDIDTSGGNVVTTPWELGGAGDVVYNGDNECFGLPELSMSAARKGVK